MSSEYFDRILDNLDDAKSDDDLSITSIENLQEALFPLRDHDLVKVYEYHLKLLDNLKFFKISWQKELCSEYPGKEEYEKMKQRATAFCVRFGRNHLYPLQRQVSQLDKYLKTGKAYDGENKEVLQKKLTTTYQSALQSSQRYVAYVSSAQNIHAVEKLKELINVLKNLNEATKFILKPIMKTVESENSELFQIGCEDLLNDLTKPPQPPEIKPKSIKKDLNLQPSSLAMYRGNLRLTRKPRKKKNAEIVPSFESVVNGEKQICGDFMKEKINQRHVIRDIDVDTEVQRLQLCDIEAVEGLHSSDRTQISNPAREALKKIDNGAEETAFIQFREISLSERKQALNSPKNVKLVCIHSERTPDTNVEEEEEKSKVDKSTSPEPVNSTFKFTRTRLKNVFQTLEKRECRQLIPMHIPQESFENYVKFKEQLDETTEHLGDIRPWDLLTRISDTLLDDLLTEVVGEVEDAICLKRFYENELKYM